jgi:hydroxyacylglutathione hydrolase
MVNSSVTIYTLPCLSDNYAYVVHNSASGTAAVVDVPEAGPLVDKISELNVPVTDIFLTHHHWDHIDGLPDLQAALTGSLTKRPLGSSVPKPTRIACQLGSGRQPRGSPHALRH